MELKCTIQHYDWGQHGTDSIVGKLATSADPDFVLDSVKPYAELWMGTHPNGPSYLKHTDKSLHEYIDENPEVLGAEVREKFGPRLPFLFKVLSVNKALSIQAHPDKVKASELHLSYPNIYKDPNYKPELAIAITPFETLCGFRPIQEIKDYLAALPELRAIIGEKKVNELNTNDTAELKAALKNSFHSLMTCDPRTVKLQLKKLLNRLRRLDESTRDVLNARLLEQLHTDFPGDIGCFGIYLFNYVTLQPGEAIYLGPNEPHAYLSGDCIECMACSDNVIRAGLTSKLKDVSTLIDILSYECEPVSSKKFLPSCEDECTEIFQPPVPDFAVAKILVRSGKASYDLIPRSTASILIVINGQVELSTSRVLCPGSVVFIPANEVTVMKVLCECYPVLMFQAFANL